MKILEFVGKLLAALFGAHKKIVPPDDAKNVSVPDQATDEIGSRVNTRRERWYMTPEMNALLFAIRSKESGSSGYNSDYRNNQRWKLTDKKFDAVRTLGRSQVTQYHEASSAIGAYQFLTATLDSLKESLGLTGQEIFNVTLQDDLAVALMIRRGLLKYLRGEITNIQFANNLAKEWASLPVVSAIQGAHRFLKKGQSYYAGDSLNKALHKPDEFLAMVTALWTPDTVHAARLAKGL